MKLDLTGHIFGRLTVLVLTAPNKFGHTMWSCRCSCGNTKDVSTNTLRRGLTKSCGCLRIEKGHERTAVGGSMDNRKHGMWKTREYQTWRGILKRCTSPTNKDFPSYGGRGIKVCDRWCESFENFFADMGTRPPHHSIERKDNNGDYSPDNCVWASRKVQQRNRRTNHLVTLRGRTMSLAAWADELGLTWATLDARIRAKWTEDEILHTPLLRRRR